MFWYHAVLYAVLIGAVALYSTTPRPRASPWWHRLACVVPLSLVVGVVLSTFSS